MSKLSRNKSLLRQRRRRRRAKKQPDVYREIYDILREHYRRGGTFEVHYIHE